MRRPRQPISIPNPPHTPNPPPHPPPPTPHQAFGGGMSPGQKRRKAAEAAAEKGIPLGLVRVATLDGVRALLTYYLLSRF